jgi:geranylgeranyl pyrophosphate synthase/uncharacterized protein with NAD-binding domain and iron-sulfur cluster
MSAAQELIERGFEVVVLERRDIAGGKARSIPVRDEGDRRSGHEIFDAGIDQIEHNLPGEHGFRFFPGFYQHVVDTMSRIPSFDGRPVSDHLVPTTRVGITQYDKPSFDIPAIFPSTPADAGTVLRDILLAFSPITELTPEDLAFFGARIWQILSSSRERRLGDYERIDWWDFIGAEQRSDAYRKFLATGITRSLVAAKARTASTRTIGDIFIQLMLPVVNPVGVVTDRVLDGPTNLVWIDPWRQHLEKAGVHYITGAEVEEIHCSAGRVDGVAIRCRGERRWVRGDHYLAALPIERIAPMVEGNLLAADPALANLKILAANVEWMNGLQLYLRRPVPAPHGHVIHIDTEWALTSISQLPFWPTLAPHHFGSSEVREVLSIDISDWKALGSDGRPAMRCSREEVMRETWQQLKRSINNEREVLRDEDLHSWFLDSDIDLDPSCPGVLSNSEPLLVNLIDTWSLRPEATTGIANLFLASDYVRTATDLATMEGANEAARRAVNGILRASGFQGEPCRLWPLREPEVLEPLQSHDRRRHAAGLPWDSSMVEPALMALQGSSPLLNRIAALLPTIAPYATPVADALEVGGQPLEVWRTALVSSAPADASPPSDGPSGFEPRLAWYSEMIRQTLMEGVPTWEPQRHLYQLVRDFLDRAGKGLRPALCLATTRALGGRSGDAVPAAAGIEMLHNAFLVHDDIEDGSEIRRGVPTLHRSAGLPIAVNAGDAMNALAMRLFRRLGEGLPPQVVLRVLDEVDHMLVESLEGQATELGWIRDHALDVGPEDYIRLVLKKTAWYTFIHPLRIGALIANPDDPDLHRFDRFGFLLGLAFQVTDDLLNLQGKSARVGKEINGDLWEGKRTLLIVHALRQAPARDRQWMESFLGRPRERRLPREVLRMSEILRNAGSLAWGAQVAASFARAAASEFEDRAFAGVAEGPDRAWLRSCVDYLVQRDL